MAMSEEFSIKSLVRDNILKLQPYSSARDEFSGSASVFLDANENPHNAPLNRYPDPKQLELKKLISEIRNVPLESIFLGNGSDEGIDLLFRVFCEPGRDNVVTVDPTYGMYGVCAQINDTEQRSVLLNEDFSLDSQRVIEAVDEKTKLIFLCSPNNPTANVLNHKSIRHIIEHVNCLVVVDEAYIDFSEEPGMLSRVPEVQNLVILQTLSKAWGLAGIRLGMVFGHPGVIGYLSAVKYPYNINSLTMEKAREQLALLSDNSSWMASILSERTLLEGQLPTFDFVHKVFPSQANFLLVRMENPGSVYTFLMKKGIIVRDRSSVALCEGCLRITVGTEEENRMLLDALSEYNQQLNIATP
jgi:histidinol-phosphate aminotransferase